ncbi:hypothetical protein GW17_00041465 [Ensete ventricosum]|nr:hypothetical protein GW17_00041465 [Ensete ventricosum]
MNLRQKVLAGDPVPAARFAISTYTARYGRYIPIRQVTGTQTARYRVVPPKIDRRRLIEEEIDHQRSIKEEKGKKKRKRGKTEEEKKEYLVRAPSPPAAVFLPREETERLPTRGEKSRRHRRRGKEEKKKRRRKNTSSVRRTHCVYCLVLVPYRYQQYVGIPVWTDKSNLDVDNFKNNRKKFFH